MLLSIAVADPGLNFRRGVAWRGIQKVPKLAEHSIKQRKTTVIGRGEGAFDPWIHRTDR